MLSALVTSAAAFAAGAPLETGGFENYTLGPLVPVHPDNLPHLGQQGWVGNAVGPNPNNQTANVENAVIQSGIAASGSKALEVNKAPGVDNRWTVLFDANPAMASVTLPQNRIDLPSNRFILIDWDMLVTDAEGNGTTALGPFFGVEMWDASRAINSQPIALLGSLGVDASTGQVVYQNQNTGYITNTSRVVNFHQWNHFALLLDFANDKYTMFLNGMPIIPPGATAAPQTFVDNSSTVNLNHFTDADIAALAIDDKPGSVGIAGTAYYDNFRVLDGVPGDFDFDGDADAADLTVWRGSVGLNAAGDANGDGDTDGDDFLIWQHNLGVDLTPAVPVSSPVPEPASWVLLAAAILLGRNRRRA